MTYTRREEEAVRFYQHFLVRATFDFLLSLFGVALVSGISIIPRILSDPIGWVQLTLKDLDALGRTGSVFFFAVVFYLVKLDIAIFEWLSRNLR